MKKEELMLYGGNDQMEAAMLRSVLLFNGKVSNPKRQDMLLKAVLAIIIYGQDTTKATDIVEILSKRFHVDVSVNEVPQMIAKLSKRGLVTLNPDDTIVATTAERGKIDFFSQLDAETQSLINGVIDRIENKIRISINSSEKQILPQNIKKALSVYYGMYGYKFFGISDKPETHNVESAVETARKGLRKPLGDATVRALADLIESPTEAEAATLEKWARAYVAMEVMNLDPMLRNFKQTKMSAKVFVIDTDVALHAITTHAKYSKDYRLMIKSLRASRCKLYIPERVVDEILDHADAAWKWYGSLGPQVVEFTDELLDNKVGNVFIEDYVKRIQGNPDKRDMQFDAYLNNFRSDEYPSLIWDCLKEVFGSEVEGNRLNLLPLDDEVKNKLKIKVLEETQLTSKGTHRSDEKNEAIAELDTALYSTLLEMNKNNEGDEKPLSRKTYLITSSDRTNKCAKDVGLYQKDICCDPKALLALMQETGSFEGKQVELINLFENPFLAITANEIWKEIDPLIKNGALLKYVELRKLRLDVDAHIDRILTCQTQEERNLEAKRQTERGYLFARDLVYANQTIADQGKQIEEQNSTIQSKDEEIAHLKELLEKKEREAKKTGYQYRVVTKKQNKRGARNKKKKK